MSPYLHQYVDRDTGRVRTERFVGGWVEKVLYTDFPLGRQGVARLFSGEWATRLIARSYFDLPFPPGSVARFARMIELNESELTRPLATYRTRTELFARQIRYAECRPMNEAVEAVVSPADGKLIPLDLAQDTAIRIKERFFDLETLVGGAARAARFAGGTAGIFRLAPADYHYFHTPVSGRVVGCETLEGGFFSVNPAALSNVDQVLSSNRRVVVTIDTDVEEGSGVGTVAAVHVAAQVIGRIEMGYSPTGYDGPEPVRPGLFVEKGNPLGIFLPGSSTVVLLFAAGRVEWCPDILRQRDRTDATSRYAAGLFGRPLMEVLCRVREAVAFRAGEMPTDEIPLGGERFLCRADAGLAAWEVRRRPTQ